MGICEHLTVTSCLTNKQFVITYKKNMFFFFTLRFRPAKYASHFWAAKLPSYSLIRRLIHKMPVIQLRVIELNIFVF